MRLDGDLVYAAGFTHLIPFAAAHEIIRQRTQQVGVLPKELAVNASATGPLLRGSGVNYDIRKVDGYSIYPRFSFKVPLGTVGDVYDRYLIRFDEIRQSLRILDQVLRQMPGGEIQTGKAQKIPVVCVGREFWEPLDGFVRKVMAAKFKAVDVSEIEYYTIVDSAKEAFKIVETSTERTFF